MIYGDNCLVILLLSLPKHDQISLITFAALSNVAPLLAS